MSAKVSSTNTKAQILKAYEELLKEVQSKKQENPKAVHQQQENIKKVASASSKTEEGIVTSISELKLKITESLDGIGKNLISEQHQLKEIQDAIAIEKKGLEELYQISANTDTLAAILMAQEEKKRAFEEEMDQKEKELQEKILAQKTTFENEMEKKRLEWEQEKKAKAQQLKEEKEATDKKRKREEEEYKYNLDHTRKKEQDVYALKKEVQERELAEKKSAFEKEIAEREKAVAEVEEELKSLRKQVEQFPKELEKAVKETEARITQTLETKYKFEKELQAKDTEGKLKLGEQAVKTLQDKIKEQEILIKQLAQKADGSEKTVKDIAMKAIESTSKTVIVDKESRKTGNDSGE